MPAPFTRDTDFNRILDPEWWSAHGTPHAELAELREQHPVWRYEGGVVDPFWLITRHEDIPRISKQPAQWLNRPRTTLQRRRGQPQQIDSLPQMDAPKHGKHRRVIQAWLQPKTLSHLEGRVREVSTRLVDALVEQDEVDIVSALAAPHPLRMICTVLGIPPEEEHQVLRLSKSLFAPLDPDVGSGGDYTMTLSEVLAYCSEVIAERRARPSDDLVSALIAAEVDGEPMSDHDLTSHLLVLISAGHDTAASAISGGILALARHPEELAKLQLNTALIPSAVEEIIRYVTPTTSFMRTAVADAELHGVRIPAGDDVCLHYAAANRDPRVFNAPDEFIIDRSPNSHLGFGVGAHACIGQVLARIEMRAMLEELIPRLRHLSLAGEPRWTKAYWVSSLKYLPMQCKVAAHV